MNIQQIDTMKLINILIILDFPIRSIIFWYSDIQKLTYHMEAINI
jgi:hypothetical protein